MDLETIILKNKLHFNLKNYLETSHNSYTTLNEGIEILKKNAQMIMMALLEKIYLNILDNNL